MPPAASCEAPAHAPPPRWWHDVLAGTAAGAAGCVIGHPLDTIKARMQAQATQRGSPRRLLSGGFLALFDGMSLPLAAKGAEQALVFSANAAAYGMLRPHGDTIDDGADSAARALAGGIAGVTMAVALNPIKYVKVQLQVFKHGDSMEALTRASAEPHSGTSQGAHARARASNESTRARASRAPATAERARVLAASLSSPLRCTAHAWRARGLRELYRGVTPGAIGDGISYGVRFLVYARAEEALRRALGGGTDPREDGRLLRMAAQGGAGWAAGTANWLVSYPLDTVACNMQAQAARVELARARGAVGAHAPELDASASAALSRILREGGGTRALWRGLTPALLRAGPTNGAIFVVYELAMEALAAL